MAPAVMVTLPEMGESRDNSHIHINALPRLLELDNCVKVACIDADGQLRGKLISKKKFLSIATDGFGFSSIMFGWDMHDKCYLRELKISSSATGFRDLLAIPDLSTFRRIPWEDNVPFFLVDFYDPDTKEPLFACPRSLLRGQLEHMRAKGYSAMAGIEYEYYTFKATANSPANFLQHNPPNNLPSLTEGMFGYSLTRPVHNKDYYYDVFDTCARFGCDLEGWHTSSGPGVFEACLEYDEISKMADRAALFKYVVKSVSIKHNITPCFMAKPKQGLPGNSGHVHISLVDLDGANLFARNPSDQEELPRWKDIAGLSDLGRQFLAGILSGLPDIMPLLAPTINSYKRLDENFKTPVIASWGLENRGASVRVIAPPTCPPEATRFEIRVPGADSNPHYVLAALLGCGWRGVEKRLEIPYPPLASETFSDSHDGDYTHGVRLANTLQSATDIFLRKDSVAREVFGDDFVDHFGGTREHELRLFNEAVTDWEMKRYIETV
ncbi:hypothetical protein ACHAQJ_005721 [Trichoderma viride]